jgi:DNA modification methylase
MIIRGNCMEEMLAFEDGSIALIITSPPYNMACGKYNKAYRDDMTEGWYKKFIFEFIRLALKKSRYLALNIQFIEPTRDTIILMMYEFRKQLKDIFIWEKHILPGTTSDNGARFSTGWEFVFLFGHDDSRSFKYHNFPPNGYAPNIKEWHRKEVNKEHRATFPVELPEYFIELLTKEGDIVLDPFFGTGTTGVAAVKKGRKYIGIDISEKYCKIAEDRISKHTNNKLTEWFDAED